MHWINALVGKLFIAKDAQPKTCPVMKAASEMTIMEYVAMRASEYQEAELLRWLAGNLSMPKRLEIIRQSAELKLEPLPPQDLILPLSRLRFPKANFFTIESVLDFTMHGIELEDTNFRLVLDPYQRAYITVLFLHCHRHRHYGNEISDKAVRIGLDAVMSQKLNMHARKEYASFLFYLARPVSEGKSVDSCSYFALLGSLLLYLWDNEQGSMGGAEVIGRYLREPHSDECGFSLPESDCVGCREKWSALTRRLRNQGIASQIGLDQIIAKLPEN